MLTSHSQELSRGLSVARIKRSRDEKKVAMNFKNGINLLLELPPLPVSNFPRTFELSSFFGFSLPESDRYTLEIRTNVDVYLNGRGFPFKCRSR